MQSEQAKVQFRPWMIEAASDYIRASQILWREFLPTPAWINASIGLEILLKSFLAEVDGPAGGIGEQYVFSARARGITGSGHDLLLLFDAIPVEARAAADIDQFRSWIEYFPNAFLAKRYPYEPTAEMGRTSVITEVAEEMLEKIIAAYKAEGCDDPWIVAYPDVYKRA